MKRIAMTLVFAFLFPVVVQAKDRVHINVGHRDKWIGASIGIGVVAVLHYKHGIVPRYAAKAVKKAAKAVASRLK